MTQLNDFFLGVFATVLFLGSAIGARVFCAVAIKYGIVALPNARSSHDVITPRGGGVVFVALWFCVLVLGFVCDWFSLKTLLIFLPGPLLVSWLGFRDDRQALSAKQRLIIQAIAAIICTACLGNLSVLHLFSQAPVYLGWVGTALVLLGLVWSTNIYNFMDGLDGVAATQGVFVFGIGGLFFWNVGEPNLAWLLWALVSTLLGFLVWNWPKARLFMGDVGSYFLGFLVAVFAIVGDIRYQIPITLWVILYGAFWFDATVTVFRRLWHREDLAVPHREHAFHRFHRLGFSHATVLFAMIVLNFGLAGIALWAHYHPRWIGWSLLFSVVLLSVVYGIIELLKPMARIKKSGSLYEYER